MPIMFCPGAIATILEMVSLMAMQMAKAERSSNWACFTSDLPFVLVYLGVMGSGAFAFGFLGIFLERKLLATGYDIIHGGG